MPFDPGVYDQSGQIFAAGLMPGLAKLNQAVEDQIREEKFYGGVKKLFRPKDDAEAQQMGFKSVAEFDNQDARQVAGMIQGKMTKSILADQDQQRQLNAEKLTELAGGRQARGRFQGMVNDASAQPPVDAGPGGSMGDAMFGLAQNAPSPTSVGATAPTGGGLSADRLMQMAVQSGLPAADTYHYMEAAANAAKAQGPGLLGKPDLAEWQAGEGKVRAVYSPKTGQFQLVPDMSRIGNAVTDENGAPIEGLVQGPNGRIVRNPGFNPAGQRKMGIDSLVEGEKALRGLDEDIAAWNSRAARAAKDKTVSAPDPAVLRSLQARRARIESALSSAATAPDSAAGAGSGDADTAELVKAKFKAGAITKEEALKRLRALGMK